LKDRSSKNLTAHDVFAAYDSGDIMAIKVIGQCIEFWAMAVANLVSVLNPEKIIFGGGVFGPALRFLPDIHKEAVKWAQPISIQKVELVRSRLEGDAGLFGAGFLALKNKNV
jgi:glucokinase